MNSPPRFAPDIPLPTSAYWPGRTARPEEEEHQALPCFDPASAEFDQRFCYGLDLFNHEFYWESHEAWEALWLPRPPGEPTREFLQGLIQAAAALLKLRLEDPKSAASLWERARRRITSVAGDGGSFLRVPTASLIADLDAAIAAQTFPASPPRLDRLEEESR